MCRRGVCPLWWIGLRLGPLVRCGPIHIFAHLLSRFIRLSVSVFVLLPPFPALLHPRVRSFRLCTSLSCLSPPLPPSSPPSLSLYQRRRLRNMQKEAVSSGKGARGVGDGKGEDGADGLGAGGVGMGEIDTTAGVGSLDVEQLKKIREGAVGGADVGSSAAAAAAAAAAAVAARALGST